MITLTGDKDGKPFHIIVLETGNIEELKKGRPAITPDGAVVICWTPDMVWLADKLADSNGDPAVVAKLIEEASKRPQKPINRPTHGTHVHKFQKPDGK